MTLAQWAEKSPYRVSMHSSGCMVTAWNPSYVGYGDLFHLSDYVVSSIEAGTVWLVSRNEEISS